MAPQATTTYALVGKATMNKLNLLATFLWKCSFSASQSKGLNDQKSLPKDKAKRHLKLQSPVVKTCIICPNRISPQAQPYYLVLNLQWPLTWHSLPPKGYHSHCSHNRHRQMTLATQLNVPAYEECWNGTVLNSQSQ